MPPTDTLIADAAAEALAFAHLTRSLPLADRTAPTPCADWTIADLADHVAAGVIRDAESFHRARLGTASPPVTSSPAAIRSAAIRLGIAHLSAALDAAPAVWPDIPMAFGAYPVADALRCLVVEFGVHADDLRIAAGDRRSTLSAATLRALFGFGELYLLLQAAPLESAPFTFTLSAPATTMSVTLDRRRAWRSAARAPPRECRDRRLRRRHRPADAAPARRHRPRLDVLDPARLAPLYPLPPSDAL